MRTIEIAAGLAAVGRVNSFASFVLALVVPLLSGAQTFRTSDPIGCYLASPPFRTPVAIDPHLDTARAVMAIEPDAVLRRPQQPRETGLHGTWSVRGDSLFAMYTNGFTGWSYRLGPTSSGWQGVAQYFTHERIAGDTAGLLRKQTRWTRIACP